MSVDAGEETDGEYESNFEPESSNESDIGTANTMRERADESRIKLWVMLIANRLLVTGLLAAGVFVTFVLIGVAFPELVSVLNTEDTKGAMFSSLLGAIITLTTLVVTISQLVISQENGPLGDQRERMSNTMDFRNYTTDLVGHPTPADPSAFLRTLVTATQHRAESLRGAVAGTSDEAFRQNVDEFTDSVIGNAQEVREELDGATFGEFDVLLAALNFNYGWKIFQIERLGYEHADSIDEETEKLFEELRTALSMFGPAREHIKTLYFEWALIDLTQLMLYTAVPAVVVAGAMLGFFGSNTVLGTTFGIANVLWLVAGAFTVALFPFLLLVSYIARIATVAKRTLAIGPLILRDSQR